MPDHALSRREKIVEAGKLMRPGGGSLETTAACQALHLICLAQQDEIDELRERLDQRDWREMGV